MIERLTDMPPGTLGFRAAGEIEREDYDEVLVPELRRAVEAGGGPRTLNVIEGLEDVDPDAFWADSKLGFDVGDRHREAWVRSAIVTDISWMARATKLFAWMIPGEARVLPRAEPQRAKAWLAGTDQVRGRRPRRCLPDTNTSRGGPRNARHGVRAGSVI